MHIASPQFTHDHTRPSRFSPRADPFARCAGLSIVWLELLPFTVQGLPGRGWVQTAAVPRISLQRCITLVRDIS